MLRPLASCLLILVLGESSANATNVPQRLAEQGRLYDASDKLLQGRVSLTFSAYEAPQGGPALWQETVAVDLVDGYFSVALGETVPFPAGLWDGSIRYLSLKVGDDDEMTPRETVRSVPYALLAGDVVAEIHPTAISVGGRKIVDEGGNWVGQPTGLQGPKGEKGEPGAPGAVGVPGARGLDGAKGEKGDRGDQGLQGLTGLQGPKGDPGAPGSVGTPGAPGSSGAKGDKGDKGDPGPQGPAGLTQRWQGYLSGALRPDASGAVGHFVVRAPDTGFISVRADFVNAVRNKFDTTKTDCVVSSQLSTTAGIPGEGLGMARVYVPGNLPTQWGPGAYGTFLLTAERSFAVTAGQLITIYLDGTFDSGCNDAAWYHLQMTAEFTKDYSDMTLLPN